MTTLEEISKCKHKNRLFHNSCVKQSIGFIRYYEKYPLNDHYAMLAKNYRKSLCKKFLDRKNYEYFGA